MSTLPLSGPAQATRVAMIGLLDSGSEALAGYPAASLLRGCWRPTCAGVSARGCALAASVLQVWIRQLDHDLRLRVPGTGPEMERIRREVARTRAALAGLLDCVATLQSHQRPAGATDPDRRAPELTGQAVTGASRRRPGAAAPEPPPADQRDHRLVCTGLTA